jgi:hypothetical protein
MTTRTQDVGQNDPHGMAYHVGQNDSQSIEAVQLGDVS